FLSFLAGCGLFCFALVLSMLFKIEYIYFVGLVIFAPLAGWFYWRGASRVEEVAFRLDAKPENSKDTIITIQAHRDELIELQSSFPFSYTVQDD
ncbi:MAG: cofactor assembly of complex C subunit B, partial [Cyanobacteria bacterium J149]